MSVARKKDAEQIGKGLQHHVSRVMAENIVESLEMVKVEEKDSQRLLFAAGDLQFSFERFLEKAPIEQVRQRIANRLFAKGLAQLQAGKGKGKLRGHADGQSLMGIPKSFRARSMSRDRLRFSNSRCRTPTVLPCATIGTHRHSVVELWAKCWQ